MRNCGCDFRQIANWHWNRNWAIVYNKVNEVRCIDKNVVSYRDRTALLKIQTKPCDSWKVRSVKNWRIFKIKHLHCIQFWRIYVKSLPRLCLWSSAQKVKGFFPRRGTTPSMWLNPTQYRRTTCRRICIFWLHGPRFKKNPQTSRLPMPTSHWIRKKEKWPVTGLFYYRIMNLRMRFTLINAES